MYLFIKLKKMPGINSGYTWLVNLWAIFLYLFKAFFTVFNEYKMLWNQKEEMNV